MKSTVKARLFCEPSQIQRIPEICSNEEVIVDGICLRRVKPGGACLKSEQCSGGATCHRGVCECPASTSSIGGFCQQEIRVGCSEHVWPTVIVASKISASLYVHLFYKLPDLPTNNDRGSA
ncbi:EB module [Necator americanus]|uniref:EB module n=1 Tax=Necator americanus TaxID=51031 RepID=W2TDW5_NECAM|nr:EB module [Necator americanus]ETN80028.1 EB module [Necator americanus]